MDAWRSIDWQRPWLAPYRAHGERVCTALEAGMSVAQALNAQRAAGVPTFVSHEELPRGEAYESFVAGTARVPTRDNPHDLFNGLAWLRWPALKRRLNTLQARQIAERGIGPTRGAVRDVLTVIDENGAWLRATPGLADALRRRDWQALFVERRGEWPDVRLVLFGHALLEKLATPRKAITAHVWLVAHDASPEDTVPPPALLPLPVLGVPGWWPANESPGFYQDRAVFRVPGIMAG